MSTLVVILSTAMACVGIDCTPAIVGKDGLTPIGKYESYYAKTNQYGYGGDIVVFRELKTEILAIHRPFPTNIENSYRSVLLYDSKPSQRKISSGCINIPEYFFNKYKYQIDEVNIMD